MTKTQGPDGAPAAMMVRRGTTAVVAFLMVCLQLQVNAANIPEAPTLPPQPAEVSDADIRVQCDGDEIVVSVGTPAGQFTGMIYPRGLSKNTKCMEEWVQRPTPVDYRLPLRGCNTMSTELDDGGIEFFNTIVIQPHLKLVTNQGKGFHIRCRYQTRNNSLTTESSDQDGHAAIPGGRSASSPPVDAGAVGPAAAAITSGDAPSADAVVPSAAPVMPGCSMRIFAGAADERRVAENVRIGDPLSLVVSLDAQDHYGIRVAECVVKDGLGWGEQKLINEEGCPTDPEIMGTFKYSDDNTRAEVDFKAHKFPYIASVYYQCNVRLCTKADGGCDITTPHCGDQDLSLSSGTQTNRLRRQAVDDGKSASIDVGTPATIEVFSGLYVNEANDLAKSEQDDVTSEKTPEDAICISQRSFAIGVCIAGLLLMLCVVAAVLFLLARRRGKSASEPGSSIYSGPYTNTAYSHSS